MSLISRFHQLVADLAVTNDVAERAVKDVTDFINASRNNDQREDIITVVNHHRELIDFRDLTKEQVANI